MRAGIVGGGLAGSLLAWRLAQEAPSWLVDLYVAPRTGAHSGGDATAASGGAVRCYENDPRQRRLAIDSMAELLGSPTLQRWAGYRPTGAICVRADGSAGFGGAGDVAAAVAEVGDVLPGSARLVPAAELGAAGWSGLPAEAVAVVEQQAGVTSPARLRDAVLAEVAGRPQVTVREVAVESVRPHARGPVGVVTGGAVVDYDVVVSATGAWTGVLLRAGDLPAEGYRTKSIQYAVHPAGAWRPPPFVDETTGLYGRPTSDGGLLLGLPTQRWDVDPGRQPVDPALHEQAARLAGERFPRLGIGPAARLVSCTDCYCDPPILALRRVGGADSAFFTFTGGSGGSAKTALAASRCAAGDLVGFRPTADLTSTAARSGHP